MSQSPAYINTKKVVEHTAANSLGKMTIKYCVMRRFLLRAIWFSARTLGSIEPEKESQSPKRNVVLLNQVAETRQRPTQTNGNNLSRSESSSSDSINSQDGLQQVKRTGSLGSWTGEGPPPIPSKPEMIKNMNSKKRQDELELRHQELLARQRQLQVRAVREEDRELDYVGCVAGAVPATAEHAEEGQHDDLLHQHPGLHQRHEEDGERLQPERDPCRDLPG